MVEIEKTENKEDKEEKPKLKNEKKEDINKISNKIEQETEQKTENKNKNENEKESQKMIESRNQLLKIENFLNKEEKIQIQEEPFEKVMFLYKAAIKQIETQIEIIKEEYQYFYDYKIIDHVTSRIKTPQSILQKMNKKKQEITYKNMIENINDIAGVRIICGLKDDIYQIKNIIEKIPGFIVLNEKDYIIKPKKSGYSSYHMIISVPVNLAEKTIYVKVEIQIRTLAMDFWANLEHSLQYKAKELPKSDKKGTKIQNSSDKNRQKLEKARAKELANYAKIIQKLDNKMMALSKEN